MSSSVGSGWKKREMNQDCYLRQTNPFSKNNRLGYVSPELMPRAQAWVGRARIQSCSLETGSK